MPFPDSPRVIYNKNPLKEVICQLRFPTILKISAGQVADFQEKIRREYPLYELQEPTLIFPQLPSELSAIVEQINIPKLPGSATHRFSTKDSKRFIALAQNFLAVAESAYSMWESFRAELVEAERALREVYEPPFYTRIGLRYQDVISRRDLGLADSKWRDLLQSHIIGELGSPEISGAIVTAQTISLIQIPEIPGAHVRLTHGLAKLPENEEQCYVIDSDFFIEQKEGLDEPFEILDRFNRLAGKLFRWAITDVLDKAMDPQPL